MKAKTVTKKKKPTTARLKKRADALFSEYIRKRDGHCLRCNTTENLQCAHIIGRRNHHLRYDPQNAITLCYRDHLHWAHIEPVEFVKFLEGLGIERMEYLEREHEKIEKLDYEETITSLKGLLNGLEKR